MFYATIANAHSSQPALPSACFAIACVGLPLATGVRLATSRCWATERTGFAVRSCRAALSLGKPLKENSSVSAPPVNSMGSSFNATSLTSCAMHYEHRRKAFSKEQSDRRDHRTVMNLMPNALLASAGGKLQLLRKQRKICMTGPNLQEE